MEQKLASQHWEMQRLTAENQRFATVHSSLKQELTDAQKELQRLQNQMDAVKTGKDQQLKLFLDKVAKMEADLKSSESAKVELQQAHAEAQSLAGARQELISQVQQMNQDLQRSRGDDQQILALMSELEVLRQEYQCCRETYDNERKLRIGHYEALQATEKNFDSMIRELEKLHAELSNAAIIDKSATATLGGQFGINADAYKENVASGKYHTRQIPYEDRYGKEHAGVAAPHPESAAGLVSAQAVYNASIVPRDIVLGITGNDGPQGIHASLASGYAARGVGVDLSATGMTAAARDSTQAPPSYGAAQQAAYVTGCDYKALCGGSNAPMHP
ncbi:protein FLX-like 2 isoform X2 [Zingiber officinale]|nr:protein FLX-like 2 isoform X2 [Zingiber officinale]